MTRRVASLVRIDKATLSNCGDLLKASDAKLDRETSQVAGEKDSGYGNNSGDEPMDDPQPSPKESIDSMDTVHRLDDSGHCVLKI